MNFIIVGWLYSHVYFVSHHEQVRLHVASRRNTDGFPCDCPSPANGVRQRSKKKREER